MEGFWVAEEIRHADQQIAKQRFHFGRGLLQKLHIAVDRFDLMHGHAPLDATVDRARFVEGKVVAGLGAEQDEDFL